MEWQRPRKLASVALVARLAAIAMSDGPNFVELGSSGRKVCQVCLGTMTFGCQNTEEEAHKLLDYYVFERGGNFLDVAEMYPAPASDPRIISSGADGMSATERCEACMRSVVRP